MKAINIIFAFLLAGCSLQTEQPDTPNAVMQIGGEHDVILAELKAYYPTVKFTEFIQVDCRTICRGNDLSTGDEVETLVSLCDGYGMKVYRCVNRINCPDCHYYMKNGDVVCGGCSSPWQCNDELVSL